MQNYHKLVVFHPINGYHKIRLGKTLIVAGTDEGHRYVKPGRWMGTHFTDLNGHKLTDPHSWANYPMHPLEQIRRSAWDF